MEPVTITMALDKSTKNTHVYAAVTQGVPPAIKTLYVEKWALPTPPPQRLEITFK